MQILEENIVNYFGELPKNELRSIASCFKSSLLKKGEYFLEYGKRCNKLSLISSGALRVYRVNKEIEVTQWIATGGFMTDLSSWIHQTPSRWNMQALTDIQLHTISREDYIKVCKEISNWHKFEKNFIAKCAIYMEERIHNHLSMSAEQRFDFFYESNKELFNRVPLQYIASMLGMTPETLSRIRKAKT